MTRDLILPGINIQHPWSKLLLVGKKTVETRGYPLPEKFRGMELAIIETPGPDGKSAGISSSRVVGIVVFAGSFRYETEKEWLSDRVRHLVPPDHPIFAFHPRKAKYGWIVASVQAFEIPFEPPRRRGRVYSSPFRIKIGAKGAS
jgi:hypothetical protein